MALSNQDRKRLWGKAANRCAICNRYLTRPGTSGDPEAVIGEEAHIVGARPGGARYRLAPTGHRDAYDNRILVCPNDHTLIDRQPAEWNEARLLDLKARHEALMAARTDHSSRSGIVFEPPADTTKMVWLVTGKEALDVVAGALAFQTTHDELQNQGERDAGAALLQGLRDWGEIDEDIGPAGHIDAEANLDEMVRDGLKSGLMLYGVRLETTVRIGEARDRWPVAYLHLRRAADVAQQAHAAV